MKGLTRNQYSSFICTAVIGFSVWTKYTVDGSCSTKLMATRKPSTEIFRRTFKKEHTDESIQCQWIIWSSVRDFNIKLTFPIFKLKQEDCIEIFEGSDEDSVLLDKLCDKIPKKSYISRSKEMLVILVRGDVEGDRQFTMTYSSELGFHTSTLSSNTQTSSRTRPSSRTRTSSRTNKSSTQPPKSSLRPQTSSLPHPQTSSSSSLSTVEHTEKIIRVVGICAAVLIGFGITLLVLKVTKCCKCLRRDNNCTRHARSSSREPVRIPFTVEQDRRNRRNMHSSNNNLEEISQPLSPQTNNGASPPNANEDNEAAADMTHVSDTDSLRDMDELPPSYESLYLNELGEPVSPPNYSPPAHRSTHPPRRVHTFN